MDYQASQTVFASADPSGKFKRWTDAQMEAFLVWEKQERERLLIHYPTGKGKSKVSLAMLSAHGYQRVIVIAPPKTHNQWADDAKALGMGLLIMSIEKFRDPDTKLPRDVPLIVDEFHKTGKHNAVGFKKLDRMAARFPAIILCSATPNYNDADRCYNICHVLDTINYMGGYPAFVEEYCTTKYNHFRKMGDVTGFKDYDGAPGFLAALPFVAYLPDEAEWTDHALTLYSPANLYSIDVLGYSGRKHRIMASDMEYKWHRLRLILLQPSQEFLRPEVAQGLLEYLDQAGAEKYLLYSRDKVVAKALQQTLVAYSRFAVFKIDGSTSEKAVPIVRDAFVESSRPAVLVGTDALAEGVDKIDKVCDHIVMFVDTNDGSKRRQLIGRVLPRGDYERETHVTTVATTLDQ